MSSKELVGHQIKTIRKKLGKTQKGFADHFNKTNPDHRCHTTRADIAKYETGSNSVPAEKYLMFLKLDPDYELEEENDFLK